MSDLCVLQLPGMGVAKNATAKIEDVSKQMLNKIPVSTFQVMVAVLYGFRLMHTLVNTNFTHHNFLELGSADSPCLYEAHELFMAPMVTLPI